MTQLVPWSLPSDMESWTYRMKDLCDLTGLRRQAIHFYIQRGLLPAGRKTGRNMAYYGEGHVKRLQLIKKLQHERFLPLKAIKAILDDQKGAFSESQEGFLADLKSRLVGTLADDPERPQHQRVAADVLQELELDASVLERMKELELIFSRVNEDGVEVIASDDVWILETWAEVCAIGIVEELSLTVDDLLMYEKVATDLLNLETQLLAARLSNLSPDRAAKMIERVVPVVNRVIAELHRAKIRNFLATIE